MTMVLYDSAVSGNCYKVRQLFAHLGIEYERREVSVIDRSNRKELLGALNPALRVPTLVLDDGRSLGESNAITFYFADRTRYLPDDRFERAQVLQWLFFEQYSHEPYIAVARFWAIAGIYAVGRRPGRQAAGRRRRAPRDGGSPQPTTGSWSASATRSRISRCMPTHTWLRRAASSSSHTPRSTRGWPASPPRRATSRSPTDYALNSDANRSSATYMSPSARCICGEHADSR